MADSPSFQQSLERLDEQLTCPVCGSFYNEPKALPCTHFFCKKCVESLTEKSGPDSPFQCPLCRSVTVLPNNDPNKLPPAFFVDKLHIGTALTEKALPNPSSLVRPVTSPRSARLLQVKGDPYFQYPTPRQTPILVEVPEHSSTKTGVPKVFILYCKDSELQQHCNKTAEDFCDDVLALSDMLRYCGIECMIDQYAEHQPNWNMWTQNMISQSDFVLIVCSPYLYRCLSSPECIIVNMGKGMFFNLSVVNYVHAPKFVPVFLDNYRPNNCDLYSWIPASLRMTAIFELNISELAHHIHKDIFDDFDHDLLIQEKIILALHDSRFAVIRDLLSHLRKDSDITPPPVFSPIQIHSKRQRKFQTLGKITTIQESGTIATSSRPHNRMLSMSLQSNVERSSAEAEYISATVLRYIAEHLPHQDWQHLGIKLGVEYSKLEELGTKHPFDKTSATLEMFRVWQSKKGKQATTKALKKALIDLKYGLLAKEIFKSTESESSNAAAKEMSKVLSSTLPISGIHLAKSKTIAVTTTIRPQTFIWREHGLKIHIDPETLAETDSDCTFTLGVTCNHTNFQFAPNVIPVSPVFYIKPSRKLRKPVTLEIEHCCELKSKEDSQGLVAMLAHTSSQTLPYKFEYLEGGEFPVGSSWGQVQVSSFTLYTFVYDLLRGLFNAPIVYFAKIYYCQIGRMIYKAVIAISRNLGHCKAVIEENCSDGSWKFITQFEFQFNGENNHTLLFVLPKDDERLNAGWKITASTPPCEVAKSVLDNTEYSWIEMTLSWEKRDEDVRELRHSIRMTGVNKEHFEISIDPHWQNTLCLKQDNLQVRSQCPQLSEAFKVLLPVASEWESIAILLSIPHDRVKAIRQENLLIANNCLHNILNEWLGHSNPQPSWNTLAEAMELLNPAKAQEIREKYICVTSATN